jgi:hypothetical protein
MGLGGFAPVLERVQEFRIEAGQVLSIYLVGLLLALA